MKKILALAVISAMIVACGGSKSAKEGEAKSAGKTQIMTIGTADTGGTMYPVGATIAKVINDNVPGVKVNTETSAGSPANTVNLQGGKIDLGMIAGDVAYQSYTGTGKFEGKGSPDIRALAACYPSLSNWITLSDSGLTTVDQFANKKLAIGPSASATAIAATAGLETANLEATKEYLGLTEGADSVGDGVHDAAHGFAGIPIGGFLNLSNIKDTTIVGYTDEHLNKIIASNGSYYKTVIPANTYGKQPEDVPTFGVKCIVAVNASMSDEMVYRMAKALYENSAELPKGHASMSVMTDPNFMVKDLPIPLHPGAEKYYKEAGLL